MFKNHNQRRSFRLALLVVTALLFGGLFLMTSKTGERLQEMFSRGDRSELLEAIKSELVQSGRLIISGGSPDAWLTGEGVFALTNSERATLGLSPYASNPSLDAIARARLADMFDRQYFEHVSPTGTSASTEADAEGFEYISIGENIALGNFEDDSILVKAWMDSPGHRANIVSEKFSDLGVAVGKGLYEGKETWIAVQIFARPLSVCIQANASLKARIDQRSLLIEHNETELTRRKEELDQSSEEGRVYQERVAEYNALVVETNTLIEKMREDVATYNRGVRAFNACLEPFS